MTRKFFYRDFTLPRAGLLAILIAMAVVAGKLPAAENNIAQSGESEARFLPAVIHLFGADCVEENEGIQL